MIFRQLNIFLTIDIGLQKVAMKSLQGKRGAIVAMDPTNGDILALVSAPSYDPNLFVNGINYDTYNGLLSSKDTPLVNRALQGTYPPGSTIKPFLGLTALTYGIREPDDTIWCPGWYRLKGSSHLYRDWKREGHGEVDFNYAIMQSCDVYYYDTANDLGISRLHDGLLNFGFGNKTGIDIGGEVAGLVPSPE
ncbi:MAG: penicillin-binding transpeptidase domain-containing protein, partial [Gammaproteobacteria bacterium]